MANIALAKSNEMKNKNYISKKKSTKMEELKERSKNSLQSMFYSMQRIDLLVISISGAGIYIVLETLKYLTDNEMCICNLIRWSGGLFLLAIILNFLSQMSGFKTNEQDYLMCQYEIGAGKKISKEEQKAINKYDHNSETYSKITNALNYSSAFIMFIALISIMSYFLFIF